MLRLAAGLVALILTLPASAQTYESAYAFGGTSSDVAESVAIDGAGNTFVAGTFEGSIDFGNGVAITSAGDSDAFVVMFDAEGTPQWARRAGTDVFNDFGEAVAVDSDLFDSDPAEGVYMAGTFTGIATFDGGANPDTTITTFSDFDAFLAKYDINGDLQWVERVGGVEQDVANSVAVTPEGSDVYLIGSFTGEAEAGDTTLVGSGSSDAYLARFTPDGDLVWARSAGGTSSDSGYDVAVTIEGDAYAVGQFSSVIQFDDDVALQSVGLSDIFIVRYGDDGDVVWAERLGGSEGDFVRGVALSSQGYVEAEPTIVFVGGSFSDTIIAGPDVLTSAGFTDVLAAALDAEGNVLWGRRGGGPAFDFAEDVQTFPPYAVPVRGDQPTRTPVYVTGYIDGDTSFEDPDNSIPVSSAGGLDGFLAAYQSGDVFNGGAGGTLINALAFGGTNRDQGTGIAVLPQTDFGDTFNLNLDPVITGFFRGTASFGGFELESAGSNDGFVARLQNCPTVFCLPSSVEPGAGVPTANALEAAYPNPFRDRTTLALDMAEAQDVTVEMFDMLGRRVATVYDGPLAVGQHRVVIEADGLPAGVYVVRAESEAFQFAQRVTLVR